MQCNECVNLKARIEESSRQIEWLARQQFGRKSEKTVTKVFPDETGVQADASSALQTEGGVKTPRKGHGTTRLPDLVPRLDVFVPVEPSKQTCPCCARTMKLVGYSEKRETSVVPQHVRERVFHCEIYRCEFHPDQVVKAKAPDRAIDGVACDHGTLAHISHQKLVVSVPIERQAEQFSNAGTPIAASTLNMWFLKFCMFLVSVAEAERAYIEKGSLAYSDDTSFRVQDKNKDGVKVHVGNEYLITNGVDAAYMIYCHGRTDASAKEIIGNFKGVLVADGLKSYKKIDGVQVAACWAHVRRYFVEAWRSPDSKTGDARAQKPVELINAIFEIDRRCRQNKTGLEELQRIRDAEAKPILDEIKGWMSANMPVIPPKSALGKAIAYLDSRWEDACRFLTDARIPLDNNLSERALRKTVLGRKNFLFAGSTEAAQAIAKAYGVMASCSLCKVDPYQYMVWALDTFANTPIESYDDITPRKYAAFTKGDAGGSAGN